MTVLKLIKKLINFIFLYSIYSNQINAQQNPSILHITPSSNADLGDTVDLSCSVQYGSNFMIIWLKLSNNPNNPPLFISKDAALTVYDNRYSIRHDDSSSTYTLQISKIQEIDTGTYQCQVVTSPTSQITADTTLTVRVPPSISDDSSRAVVVAAGDSFVLSCNATGNPQPNIVWRRENNGLLPTGGVVYKGNTIRIYDASKDDRGIYYCIADNGVGKGAKRSVSVDIEFAPEFVSSLNRYSQAPGFVAEMFCLVEASPEPEISWLKDGYQIVDNKDHYSVRKLKLSNQITTSSLHIQTVERRDYGTYVCRAINKLGDRQQQIFLGQAYNPVCPPACQETNHLALKSSSSSSSIPTIEKTEIIITMIFISQLFLFK